ncbi:MAG: ABC transporter permease, partial [Holophagales bacterium]|nr:ABC transporter permease [Holophagales bacterium]
LAERVPLDGNDMVLERRSGSLRIPLGSVTNYREDGISERRRTWLGSDALGRDVLSRVLHGSRVSLTIGLLAAGLALTAGTFVGSCAAIGGRFVDQSLMRLVDGLLCFPHLALVLLLATLYRPDTTLLVLLIGGTGWMGLARLVRAELLRLKQERFALAAAAAGRSPAGVLFRHLLPNATTPLLVDASLRVGASILVESALSFLGLGVQPPQPSWGSMIADGQSHLTTAWWIAAFPGLMVAAAVLGSSLLADGLSDRLAGLRAGGRETRRRSPWAIRTWLGQA